MNINTAQRALHRCLLATGVLLSILEGGTPLRAAAPANDDFANAFEIPSVIRRLETNLTATLVGATIEPGEELVPELSAWNTRGTIWWKWTCPADGRVRFEIFSQWAFAEHAFGAYAGTALSNLTTVIHLATEETGPFDPTFDVEGGITYWIVTMMSPITLAEAGPVQGVFDYLPKPPAAPANDLFANRVLLTGSQISLQSTNIGAYVEEGEPGGLAATVWYSWTAPTNGAVSFSASSATPGFNARVNVFRGQTLPTLTLATPTVDGFVVVDTGEIYQLQVGSANGVDYGVEGAGLFTLSIQVTTNAPDSINDSFANRLDATCPRYQFAGSIYGATNEPGEPLLDPSCRQTLWWRFVPPDDGVLQITVVAPFTNALAVYDGGEFAQMQRVPEFISGHFRVTAAREYAIQVASDRVPYGGFSLDAEFYSATNNSFAGRERLTGTNITFVSNFTFATAEPDEPLPGASNTVWATWTAPVGGRLRYFGFSGGQHVFMFTGTSLADLQPASGIAAGSGSYLLPVNAGDSFHFQISGPGSDFSFVLQFEPFQIATNDHFAQAEWMTSHAPYCNPRLVRDATMELGEPLHMGQTPQKSLWWKWRAPHHMIVFANPGVSFVSNVVIAIYQGTSLESLRLVAKGTNSVQAAVTMGEVYSIATAVAAEADKDVMLSGHLIPQADPRTVPGNLLREPSWEGTGTGPQFWGMSGSIGGYVNERGGCDGVTWPALGTGARVWQDFSSIPGHNYRVRFGLLIGGSLSGCCGPAGVRVLWNDRELGVARIPEQEAGYWHCAEFFATASNTTTRVTFENVHRNVELDAFSVVDMSAPPVIMVQPQSISTLAGSQALFVVGPEGASPLDCQWFFNGSAIPGATGRILLVEPASPQNAGDYFVTITNAFGAVTSAVASLSVDAPTNATILVQPYGDVLPAGSFFNVSVVAVGLPPLTYQWFLNGEAVASATNRSLTLANAQPADAGLYQVRVQNPFSSVLSLTARLVVTNAVFGGGALEFCNRCVIGTSGTNEAPVFDIDGTTRLAGSGYLAQLYAGPSVETLRPVGQPTQFPVYRPGIFRSIVVVLPNVPIGGTAFAQARVWESDRGTSYEEARALGGKFGRSPVITIVAGNPAFPPPPTEALQSFSLQAGLPRFSVGRIELVERHKDGLMIWALNGEAAFRYLVEKTTASEDGFWQPYVILTNQTGQVTFTDVCTNGSPPVFYRSRILD